MSVSYCVGCGKKHDSHFWKYRKYTDKNGKEKWGWFCAKWAKPSWTKQRQLRRWSNFAPEELLAGRDLGIKGIKWGEPKSTKTFTEERRDAGLEDL